jgi:hypothetical protein
MTVQPWRNWANARKFIARAAHHALGVANVMAAVERTDLTLMHSAINAAFHSLHGPRKELHNRYKAVHTGPLGLYVVKFVQRAVQDLYSQDAQCSDPMTWMLALPPSFMYREYALRTMEAPCRLMDAGTVAEINSLAFEAAWTACKYDLALDVLYRGL